MKKFLYSLDVYANFNFITYFITLNRNKKQQKDIANILNKNYIEKFNNSFEENVYCTLFHEVTHFLDLTTTAWGLEYSYRKLQVIKKNFDQNTIDVFKVNVSEIEIFNDDEISFRTKIDFNNIILTHSLEYEEKWGGIIVVNIFKDSLNRNNLIARIPVNMLTILETNAVATEYLLKLKYGIQFESEIEKDFDSFIKNPEYLEYNILLLLLRKGFDFLSLEQLFIFIKYLIKTILNLDMINFSSIANLIERSFNNKIIGNTIGMELRRGMNRDILIFKLILIFNSMIEENPKLKEELIQDPKKFINKFLFDKNFSDYEIKNTFNLIKEDLYNIFNYTLIEQSFLNNYPLIKENLETNFLLKDFKLPDILLKDQETIVIPSNRINFNINKFFDTNIENIVRIEKELKKNMYKFHIDPIQSRPLHSLCKP
jgi:hypothetical protein